MYLKSITLKFFPGKGGDWLVGGNGRNGAALKKVGTRRAKGQRVQKTGAVTKTWRRRRRKGRRVGRRPGGM